MRVPSHRLLESAAIATDTLRTRNIEPDSSSPGTTISDAIVNPAPVAITALATASRARRAPSAWCVGWPAAPLEVRQVFRAPEAHPQATTPTAGDWLQADLADHQPAPVPDR